MNDIQMYIYAAHNICALFFTFNHQNYSRWLTKNLDELMNMEQTHPGLIEEFKNGALSIRRTQKIFCRTPVDLTLEQTINANAANKLTGISAFTNNLHARQKWSETHTVRTAIIAEFLERLKLTKLQDNVDSVYQSKKFKIQLDKFTLELNKNVNPFCEELNQDKLFNLSSGRAASAETTECLLNAKSNGLQQMNTFIKECQLDKKRFERGIKRNVIKNFTVETFKNNKPSPKNSDATKAERNILGHVLCLAVDKKIELSTILSYPLTAVPHSLAHPDGTMISNMQRGELTSLLMSNIVHPLRSITMKFDVDVIDGFYLLNNFRDSPVKYGLFVEFVLRCICNTDAREIHLIFDFPAKRTPRDIDVRRHKEMYDSFPVNFTIQGPNQERISSLTKCLSSDSFKQELVQFFIKYWSNDEVSAITLGTKRVFLSAGSKCYLYSNTHEKGKIVRSFENNHYDMETKMIMHMDKVEAPNVRIKVYNPDIIIILLYLLYHIKFMANHREFWIETGDSSRNTIQIINVRQIFGSHSPTFINALPAWYVFTGSLYEPSFYGKGRKTCYKVLKKKEEFQLAFENLGTNFDVKEEDMSI